jgi:thioredoxin 1
MEIVELVNESDIEDMVTDPKNKDKLFVIDCGASWCPPCKTFGKFYHKFVENYNVTDRVVFCYLDIDNASKFCEVNNISSIPTILFIKKSEVVERMVGPDTEKFKNILNKCLKQHTKTHQSSK